MGRRPGERELWRRKGFSGGGPGGKGTQQGDSHEVA